MSSQYQLYFFEDKNTGKKRNTGILARNVTEAKSKLKRPSAQNAALYKRRAMTASEKKQANRGDWVTGGPTGPKRRVETTKSRGYGPSKKASAKAQRSRKK